MRLFSNLEDAMKKLLILLFPMMIALTGCGKSGDAAAEPATEIVIVDDKSDEIMPADEVAGEISAENPSADDNEKIAQDPGYMGEDFYQEKAWEYVSEVESVDSIIDPENPEIKEISALPESYWQITDDYDTNGSFYEVTYRTIADEILGPIVVYMDKEGTIIGLAYRE